jgi:hypothetical protein
MGIVAFAGLVLAGSAFAQGAAYSLNIPPGGRQNGLGEAGVALMGDATGATWWNPALLGFTDRSAVQITYAQLVPGLASDVNYNYGTYIQPIKGWGALGLGMVFLSYGQSEGTDNNGNPTGVFSSYEFSPALYGGTRILPDLAVGASVKWVRVHLAPEANRGVGTTFGLDLGALYRIPAARLSFGANIQNLGPSIVFVDERQANPIGRNVKVGFAWEAVHEQQVAVTVVGDFNQSLVTNEFRTYNPGIEVAYAGQLAGRVGWVEDHLGSIGGLTWGIGVNWKSLNLDFGSIPQAKDADLPNVNKITLGYRF